MRPRFLAVFSLLAAAYAQTPVPQDQGLTRLYQDIQQLKTTARVMMVTAHPDDEDGGLLTLLAREKGAKVMLFTLTRGEGGQNKFGDEVGDELGVIRTVELLEADRFYGVEQRFSPVADFGFSKTPEETFEKWGGHDIALAALVQEIRTFRPDVLIARFSGTQRDGHAHHQASAILTREAFAAAADPKRFTEKLRDDVTVWQPKRLLMGIAQPDAPGTIKIDTGAYAPLLGMSFAQFALEGLSHQTSQGVGGLRLPAGHRYTYYSVAGGAAAPAQSTDVLAGLDLSVDAAMKAPVDRATSAITPDDTTRAAQPLAAGRDVVADALRRLGSSPKAPAGELEQLQDKQNQFESAVQHALAVSVEATIDNGQPPVSATGFPTAQNTFQTAAPGESFGIIVRVVNRSRETVTWSSVEFESVRGVKVEYKDPVNTTPLAPGDAGERHFRVSLTPEAALTRPAWHRVNSQAENVVKVDVPELAGKPLPPYPLRVRAVYEVSGAKFETASEPLQAKTVDPVRGQLSRPLIIAPALSVAIEPASQVTPVAGAKSRTITVGVTSYAKAPTSAAVRLDAPRGWQVTPASRQLSFAAEGEHQSCQFELQPAGGLAEQHYTVSAVAESAGRAYREGFRMVGRPDIGEFPFYRPAQSEISAINVKVPASLKVGYITGAGDEVESVTKQLGVAVQEISSTELASGDLSRYDTIVLGIRAYDVRADVRASRNRLLRFVEQGGTVVMMNNQSAAAASLLPYPAVGSNDRVSVEEAPVKVLQPQAPVFHAPNEIAEKDWNGWVQERGLAFLTSWDAKITPLLSMNDPGEPATEGGLLEARYGKGLFIYSGLAFARQLPAGVPGAVRLWVNLISAGHASH